MKSRAINAENINASRYFSKVSRERGREAGREKERKIEREREKRWICSFPRYKILEFFKAFRLGVRELWHMG